MSDEDLNAPGGTDNLEAILHDIRERFVTTFSARCDAVTHLVERLADPGEGGSRTALLQIVHRLTGLSGTIGFTELGREAGRLETLLHETPAGPLDQRAAADIVGRMRTAFARDLQQPAPDWTPPPISAPRANKILIVEDDVDQAKLMSSWLRHAGYATKHVAAGTNVLSVMEEEPPDLVLLDVGLPGLDGYAVCQRLKASPEFSRTPVIFLTTRASVDDRLLGLALGADDYVTKPADRHELLLRIRLRLKGRSGSPGGGGGGSLTRKDPRAMLPFDAFTMVARAELERHAAALALVRAPLAHMPAVIKALSVSTRRGDAMAHIDPRHLAILLPDMPITAAHDRLRAILESIVERGATGLHAGVAAIGAGESFDALLADADDAFVTARQRSELVATRGALHEGEPASPALTGTAVLMDDEASDPATIDRVMQSAGLRTIRAADGADAIDVVRREQPDVLLLDVVKPSLRGLDVLQAIGPQDTRPQIVVLASREHEEALARAFELGADDYVTRPYAPQDLLVRVTRLMR